MEITFLDRFTNSGVTDNIAAFVRVENGVICDEFRVNIGARLASTIRQNASAPPNTPNLHNTRAIGAIIKDTPTILRDDQTSGLTKIRIAESTEKPIQRISFISLFFTSKKHANPSIVNAAITRATATSDRPSSIEHHSNMCMGYFHFSELVDQSYMVEIAIAHCEVPLCMAQSKNQEIHPILFRGTDCGHDGDNFDLVSSYTSISATNCSYIL